MTSPCGLMNKSKHSLTFFLQTRYSDYLLFVRQEVVLLMFISSSTHTCTLSDLCIKSSSSSFRLLYLIYYIVLLLEKQFRVIRSIKSSSIYCSCTRETVRLSDLKIKSSSFCTYCTCARDAVQSYRRRAKKYVPILVIYTI